MLRRFLSAFRRDRGPSADAWQQAWSQLPWLRHLSSAERKRLNDLALAFVGQKQFSGAHDFQVNDVARACIALQACLPVLNMGLDAYSDFVEIIIYPDHFIVPRQTADEAGVIHESVEELAGESMDGGPVVLAWPDIDPQAGAPGINVIIHEFIHKLDLLDGEADGAPPLPSSRRSRWLHVLHESYERFCSALERIEAAIPPDVDPESEAADSYFTSLPLDPYAATDPAEFFAVAAEAFFTFPQIIARDFPDLYREFVDYFGQDPASIPTEEQAVHAPTATTSPG